MLVEFFSSHGLLTINEKDGPAYSGLTGESWIDITASSIDLARKIQNWRISEDNTLSEHNLILFSLMTHNNAVHSNRTTSHPTRKFATQVGNWRLFQQKVVQHRQQWEDLINNSATKEQLDTAITTIWDDLEDINKTCLPHFYQNKIHPMVVSKIKCLKKTGKCIKTQSQNMQQHSP